MIKIMFMLIKKMFIGLLTGLQHLTKIIETKLISGKIYGNSRMVLFSEMNQAPSPYSDL